MNESNWNRKCYRINEDVEEVIEHWEYGEDDETEFDSYTVSVRRFFSEWGYAKQVSICKNILKRFVCKSEFSKEPSMAEKLFVLKGVDAFDCFTKPIPLEVFPAKKYIVDRVDAYHVWILEQKNIPFYTEIKVPKFVFSRKRISINGKVIKYFSRIFLTSHRKEVRIFFLKSEDTQELKWYDKQNFKDEVVGEDVVAFEIITSEHIGLSALVCMPETVKKLPFGLK